MKLRPPWQPRSRRITVREAWLRHEDYAGQRVSLAGVVRSFDGASSRAYFTLDDGPQRVGLRGDAARLRALTNRPVRAIGTLSFRAGVGIFLDVASIEDKG